MHTCPCPCLLACQGSGDSAQRRPSCLPRARAPPLGLLRGSAPAARMPQTCKMALRHSAGGSLAHACTHIFGVLYSFTYGLLHYVRASERVVSSSQGGLDRGRAPIGLLDAAPIGPALPGISHSLAGHAHRCQLGLKLVLDQLWDAREDGLKIVLRTPTQLACQLPALWNLQAGHHAVGRKS